jgi:putative membrane protein
MVSGTACVAAAVLPPVGKHDELFPLHIVQHLLIGMAGPGLLALSAPITLALRSLPAPSRGVLLRVLHGRAVGVISSPVAALSVDIGGLYVLYLTGLYGVMERHELLHAVVHLHMFMAGCLLSWVLVGVDPVRRRSVTVKVVTLAVVGAAHDTLSKLMYAHDLPNDAGTIFQRHLGAEVMYYGDTAIGLALAVVVMTQWWRATGRSLTRAARRRRTGLGPVAHRGASCPPTRQDQQEGPSRSHQTPCPLWAQSLDARRPLPTGVIEGL